MQSKINVMQIIRDHLKTLRRFPTDKPKWGDYAIFFVVPIGVAVALVISDVDLHHDAISVLITALAIFGGLLLNLLLLAHSIVKGAAELKRADLRHILVRELYSNIAYAILVSLVALVVLVVLEFSGTAGLWPTTLTGVTYFLLAHFLLTLLMVLQRVHVILSLEFDEASRKPSA